MKKRKELAYINYESWKQEAEVRRIEYKRAGEAYKRAIKKEKIAYKEYIKACQETRSEV